VKTDATAIVSSREIGANRVTPYSRLEFRHHLLRHHLAPDFRAFANAGEKLASLHLDYEKLKPWDLDFIETPRMPLSYRVEDKMRLSKDKLRLTVNPSLTLASIPREVFEYRLGNRSALEWVIDQYQVSTDKRSGITSDPNRPDDPEYIVRLVGQVIRVSLDTVKIVKDLPAKCEPVLQSYDRFREVALGDSKAALLSMYGTASRSRYERFKRSQAMFKLEMQAQRVVHFVVSNEQIYLLFYSLRDSDGTTNTKSFSYVAIKKDQDGRYRVVNYNTLSPFDTFLRSDKIGQHLRHVRDDAE